jgi:tetratricopeptide (TPR) repeat protein
MSRIHDRHKWALQIPIVDWCTARQSGFLPLSGVSTNFRKRKVAAVLILILAMFLLDQPNALASQNQPASQASATPQGWRPPRAKTHSEYDAYKAVVALTDPAALEKAADHFAAEFPSSELRLPIYRAAMQRYQDADDPEKMMEMGRKVLLLDPDDPQSLLAVGEVLTERTRETDRNKDERYSEAIRLSQRALETIDSDLFFPPGTPREQIGRSKTMLRSEAYLILGSAQYGQGKYEEAESSLRKSIDAYPAEPDALQLLRLALSLDKQEKYSEALKYASQAVSLSPENTPLGKVSRTERERLVQLTDDAARRPSRAH